MSTGHNTITKRTTPMKFASKISNPVQEIKNYLKLTFITTICLTSSNRSSKTKEMWSAPRSNLNSSKENFQILTAIMSILPTSQLRWTLKCQVVTLHLLSLFLWVVLHLLLHEWWKEGISMMIRESLTRQRHKRSSMITTKSWNQAEWPFSLMTVQNHSHPL